MSIINAGTVSITTGTTGATFTNSDLYDKGASTGDLFQIDGQDAYYHLAAPPPNNGSCTLLETYGGPTVTNGTYQILTDFLTDDLIAIDPSMKDSYYAIKRNFQKLSDKVSGVLSPIGDSQIVTKFYLGTPVLDREWGFMKWTPNVQIDKIRIYTDENPPFDGTLVLDLAIDDTYQNLNLTVPITHLWAESSTLTYAVPATKWTKFKWKTVPTLVGAGWIAEVTYHSTVPLVTRNDFTGIVPGELTVDRIIGNGYKFPVKTTLFGLHYEFLENPPLGSSVILELYKNDAALGTPVTITLPVNQLWGYISFSQTTFLTTDIQTYKINQVGSTYPGSMLIITPHGFQSL